MLNVIMLNVVMLSIVRQLLAGIHHASYDLLAIKTAEDFARSFENITLPVFNVFILFIEKYIFCHLALLPTLILAGKVRLPLEPRPVRDFARKY
jgi:hypothetical protein